MLRAPCFSFDGRTVYVACGSTVRALSVLSGSLLCTFRGHTSSVTGVALHPTAPRQVVTCSLDGHLRIWDGDDGTCLSAHSFPLPLARLATAPQPAACLPGGGRGGGRVYVVGIVLNGGGAESYYPVGEEPACLQQHPPPATLPFVLDAAGAAIQHPGSALIEVTLNSHVNITQRTLFTRPGLSQGLAVRCLGYSTPGGIPDCAVALGVERSLFLARLGAFGGSCTERVHAHLLSTLALHPEEPQVTTGDSAGRLYSWYLPMELSLLPPTPPRTSSSPPSSSYLEPIPAPPARCSQVHWHSHAAWATAYTPDASFLLSGGEENTLVLWQLGKASAGGGAPRKEKQLMNFLPRLGSRVQALASYAFMGFPTPPAAQGREDSLGGPRGGDLESALGPHHSTRKIQGEGVGSTSLHNAPIRDIPPLLFAVVQADNTLRMVHGVTLATLWTERGFSLAGLCAILPSSVERKFTATVTSSATAAVMTKPGKRVRPSAAGKLFPPPLTPPHSSAPVEHWRKAGFGTPERSACVSMITQGGVRDYSGFTPTLGLRCTP